MRWSPSQVNRADRCLRLWWMTYPGKRKMPGGPWLAEGNHLHELVARYLITGQIPTEHGGEPVEDRHMALVGCMAAHLPTPPHPADYVEMRVGDWGGDGPIGVVDLVDMHEGLIRITDHKFRGSWRQAAMSEAELRRDVQALVYTLLITGSTEPSWFRWLEVNKKQTACRPVQFRYETGEALELFESIVQPTVEAMAAIEATEPWEAPDTGTRTNPSRGKPHCSDYNGCPFINECRAWGSDVDGHAAVSAFARGPK